MTEILLLCTANVCRSPMAAALLARELAARGVPAVVGSAGTLGCAGQGQDVLPRELRPPPEVVSVMAGYGLDLTGHRSRPVTAADLAGADLIIAMTREHLRHASVACAGSWPRSFTLRELVRRGSQAGRRPAGESLHGWLARVHDGRSRLALLGDSAADDVADPVGGPPRAYAQTAADLLCLVRDLAQLCWPGAPARA